MVTGEKYRKGERWERKRETEIGKRRREIKRG